MLQWEFLLYPAIFFAQMASCLFSLIFWWTLLFLYGYPNHLMEKLVLFIYCSVKDFCGWIFWSSCLGLALLLHPLLLSLSPFFWIGLVLFLLCTSVSNVLSCCPQSPPIAALSLNFGVFNWVYCLYMWMAFLFLCPVCSFGT